MDGSKPKVSIIVPVYNVEKYLLQCLDSLLLQTLKDIEIVCVNDGSTDNSLNILRNYASKDARIVIIDQKNQGLSGARNTGVHSSHGDYLMFVDSDDWIDTQTCEAMYNNAVRHDADIVMCTYVKEFGTHSTVVHTYDRNEIVCSVQEGVILRLFGPLGEEINKPENIDLPVSAWGKLYKSEIAKSIDFIDTKKIGTEDLLYMIEVFTKSDIFVYMDIPFYHYRRSDYGTLTTKHMKDKYERWITLYDMLSQIIETEKFGDEYKRALNNRIAFSIIGLGLNEILADKSIWNKKNRMKEILNSERYTRALDELEISGMPMHWKFFFFLCKHKYTFSLVLLLQIMELLRTKIKL